MQDYFVSLVLSALPAMGSAAGGWLAEPIPPSNRNLSLALHTAAGVALAVVGVELMPQVLQAELPWLVILAFVSGSGFFVMTRWLIRLAQSRFGEGQQQATAWLIFLGVAVDLFSDGLMVGTGSTITLSLGVILALGQVLANIPGGLVTLATFKNQQVCRRKRRLISFSFLLPATLGSTIGYWAVRGQSELVKFTLLAFTAGVLTTIVVENLVPEAATKENKTYMETFMFAGGFALFALLSNYLG